MLPEKFKQAYTFKENLNAIFLRPNDNYAPIDGLRALSLIWIFIFHCFLYAKYHYGYDKLLGFIEESPIIFDWIWNADKAVDTFFFVSGFLISGLLFREQQSDQKIGLLRFYGRRYLRLTPIYVFSMLIFLIMRGPHWENLWQNLLYINNFFEYEEMAMVWTWTLAVEEQFYLIFPITLILIYKRQNNFLLYCSLFFILSFFIRAYIVYSDPLVRATDMSVIISDNPALPHYASVMYDNLYTRYGVFICGIFLSYLHCYHGQTLTTFLARKMWVRSLNVSIILLLACIVWLPTVAANDQFSQNFKELYMITNRNLYAICLSWICLLCIYQHQSFSWINRFLSLKLWYPFAQLSYSMYIFHIMFISGLMFQVRWLSNNQYIEVDDISFYFMLGFCALALLMTFIFSIFTYVLIEKPFMNMRGSRNFTLTKTP